jgi:D-proline reductase (dithiol) PrdB
MEFDAGVKEANMAAVSPKSDLSWVQGFRGKYKEWFQGAKPLLEAHQGPAAFKTYPFVSFSQTPWSPHRTSLPEVCLAVVTTAGLFRKGIDDPFADTAEGDPRVIQLPSNIEAKSLDTAHTHIPQELIRADVNVAFPIDRLRDLVKEKKVGSLAPRFFSFVGYQTRADEVAMEMAPNIAAAMVSDKVTLALIVPA